MILQEINNISSLTPSEVVGIIAEYHKSNEKSERSVAADPRYTPEQLNLMKASQKFSPVSTLGMTFTKPFTDFSCDGFEFVVTLYNQYEKHGTLPYEGSLTDQPNKIIEAFNVIKALSNEAETKERKRQEQLSKASKRK